MALSNYTELKAALKNWCSNRSDVDANAEDFIRLAESNLNLQLRNRKQVTQQILTPVNGEVILPQDFAGVRSVVLLGSPRRNLAFVPFSQFDQKVDVRLGGYAMRYTIVGEKIITGPMATEDIELTYYAEIPALSDDTPGTSDVNWLLTKYPGLYLEAAQLEFYRWNKDMDDMSTSAQRVQAMIDRMNGIDDLDVYGDATGTIDGQTP